MFRRFCLVGSALVLYSSPTIGSSLPSATATLTVTKGYDAGVGLGRSSEQLYQLGTPANCKKWKRFHHFSWIGGSEFTGAIPAGSEILFRSTATRNVLNYFSECTNHLSFVPIAGHRYRAVQIARVQTGCDVEIIDEETKQTPPDTKMMPNFLCIPEK